MSVYYVEPDSLDLVFNLIYRHYATTYDVPDYQHESSGLDRLYGVLTGVQNDMFYPEVLDKATYLLLQINTGHFFSNGNKRLALVVTDIFLGINELRLQGLLKGDGEWGKDDYISAFKKHFPTFEDFEDEPDFTPADFAGYNLSVIIADHQKHASDFDNLKLRTRTFLDEAVTEWKGVTQPEMWSTDFFHMGELVEFNSTKKIFEEPDKQLTKNYVKGYFG